MGMIKEFKEFAVKGNVMDLAVGVIIGGAFSTIVNSVVKDLIMPVIGVVTGGSISRTSSSGSAPFRPRSRATPIRIKICRQRAWPCSATARSSRP